MAQAVPDLGTPARAAAPAGGEALPGASPAADAAGHLRRLQALAGGADRAAPSTRRRGSTWQQPRRHLEQEVRQEAAAFRHWVARHGLNRIASAARLGISARTLRCWEGHLPAAVPGFVARGRPVRRSQRQQRTAVLELLASAGPGVGRAVLDGQFPDLPRAELADLLKRYRRVWVRRHAQVLNVLHWQRPGTVWAMDYARPPLPLEDGFTDLLAVRDLASGMQLLWLPVPEATAQATVSALLPLFLLYGAPLVLKLDNGPPFVAEALRQLLAQWEILPLYSPPGWPRYNGSIEAGIGALKVRTHYQALRQGRVNEWTLEDTEAARQQANTLGRPWGAHAPTPAACWQARLRVTGAERDAFADTVAGPGEEATARSPTTATPATAPAGTPAPPTASAVTAPAACPTAAAAGTPAGSDRDGAAATETPQAAACQGGERGPSEASRPAPDRAAQRRQSISRALVAHGYLVFTRRRIPPPIRGKKLTRIT